jgi:glycosyltransferase 2 family protein
MSPEGPPLNPEVPAQEAEPSSRRGLFRVLRIAMGLVVAVFVVATIRRFVMRWEPGQVRFNYPLLGLTTVVLVVSSFLQAMGWHSLLVRMAGKPIPHWPLFSTYMLGQLARYTPGKVGLPLVRLAGAPRLGVSTRLVGSSVGIEVLSWLSVGALVGMGATMAMGGHTGVVRTTIGDWGFVLLAVIVIGIAVLNRVDRNRLPASMLRALHIEGQGPLLPSVVLGYQVLSWLGWLGQGVLLVVGVGGDWTVAWASAGVFVLAPIAGFLALVAPGGLGVREAILSLALAPDIGVSRALCAALLARGTSLVADLIAFGISQVFARQRSS